MEANEADLREYVVESVTRRIQRLEETIFAGPEVKFTQSMGSFRRRRRLLGGVPIFKFRKGHLKPLPKEYKGESHVIVTKHLHEEHNWEWVEYEEVPGPAPSLAPQNPLLPRYFDVVFVPTPQLP